MVGIAGSGKIAYAKFPRHARVSLDANKPAAGREVKADGQVRAGKPARPGAAAARHAESLGGD